MRQGSFDEALDMLEQAKQLVPEDAELKAKVQTVLMEYAAKSGGRKPIPGMAGPVAAAVPAAPAPVAVAPAAPALAEVLPPTVAAAPAPAPESVSDIERRLREQIELEYRQRKERGPNEPHEQTREQVLARAGAPDMPAAPALTPPPPPAYHRPDEAPAAPAPLPAAESAIPRPEPVPAVVGAGVGPEPVRARPRVSYV